MRRASAVGIAALQITLLGGCATLTRDATQTLAIETVDDQGRPVHGMRCHVSNGSSEYFGDSPMFGLEVHRSWSDLEISCKKGNRLAEGTAVSQGGVTGAAAMLLPGGSAYMVIDHLTGYRYAYPTWIRLQVGQKMVFHASDEVSGKPVPGVAVRSETSAVAAVRAPAPAPAPTLVPPPAPAPAPASPLERALVRTD
jgi:hypothetical protein